MKTLRRQFKCILGFSLVASIIIMSSIISEAKTSVEDSIELQKPTVQQVLKYGYPVNAFRETYGPDTHIDGHVRPDLQLACNRDGVEGYIRFSDIDQHVSYSSTSENTGYNINMYLQDGRTVIGSFYVSPGMVVNK